MMIDDHDLASALESRGQRSHQSNWSGPVNDNGVAGRYAGQFGGMPAGWENVREHHIVELLFRILRFWREPQAIEVAVRNAKILSLPAIEGSHPGESIGRAGHPGKAGETEGRETGLAVPAKAAANVERKTHHVALLDAVDCGTHLRDFSHVLVAKHPTRLHIGSTLIHVQVGAAYVGSCDSHQHVGRLFDFCVNNIFHFDIAWSVVDDCFHG